MATLETNPGGSYRTLSFERATAGDAMRAGVITCPPEASLRQVARIMATEHIHSVIVRDRDTWMVLTDTDLLRAAGVDLDAATAGEVATAELPEVGAADPLERAAQLMADRRTTHALVTGESGRPVGVLSTLDIAGILAWGRA
ncbi:MAG TPA: CBS domain-containing protein [Solirubrobacterales bacterium]|nr:CBS domain-containing protein [Solirubrobacterales bacterium]